MKEDNPVTKFLFYTKEKPNEAKAMTKQDVSYMLPEIFLVGNSAILFIILIITFYLCSAQHRMPRAHPFLQTEFTVRFFEIGLEFRDIIF